MKTNIALTSTLLGLATATVIFSGCMRPTERPSVEDKTIAGKAFAIKDLAEITAEKRSVYIKSAGDKTLAATDKDVAQVDLAGKADDLLKKVKDKKTKADLDEALSTGSVAIVVLDDQVKILKVVADTVVTPKYEVLSRTYLGQLKEMAKKPASKFSTEGQAQAMALKYSNPAKWSEKFGLVEITSLKVEKVGVLDNARNDYGEKKSFLIVNDTPFEVATHIVISGEMNSATGELLVPLTDEEKAAATKAAAEVTK